MGRVWIAFLFRPVRDGITWGYLVPTYIPSLTGLDRMFSERFMIEEVRNESFSILLLLNIIVLLEFLVLIPACDPSALAEGMTSRMLTSPAQIAFGYKT